MTEERFSFENKQGVRLAGVLHKPKKKTSKCVILCHGFTGSKGHWHNEAHALEVAGLAALRFDFAGCGESGGAFAEEGYSSEVADLISAIDVVEKAGYKEIGVVGHSFGGGVVLLASAKEKRIKAVIATAPTVFPDAEMLGHYAKDRLSQGLGPKFFSDVKKVDVIGASKKRTAPLLIITGTADDVVPAEQSKELFEKAAEPKELRLFGGAGHNFEGKEDELVETLVTWMKKHL